MELATPGSEVRHITNCATWPSWMAWSDPPCHSVIFNACVSSYGTKGPLVTHLRMTVYKGVGEQGSSQSPALNFDRLAEVSLRLNKAYVDKINRMQNLNKSNK